MKTNFQAQRIWVLCKDAAISIYDAAPPATEYAGRVARLLFGTCAQESGFVYERQLDLPEDPDKSDRGAFSLWQLEKASIVDWVTATGARPTLLEAVNQFLACYHEPALESWMVSNTTHALLRYLETPGPAGDATACALARLHYMFRTPSPVPASLEGQAAYYKHWYNTDAGAATPSEYIANWFARCGPVLSLDKTLCFAEWKAR